MRRIAIWIMVASVVTLGTGKTCSEESEERDEKSALPSDTKEDPDPTEEPPSSDSMFELDLPDLDFTHRYAIDDCPQAIGQINLDNTGTDEFVDFEISKNYGIYIDAVPESGRVAPGEVVTVSVSFNCAACVAEGFYEELEVMYWVPSVNDGAGIFEVAEIDATFVGCP